MAIQLRLFAIVEDMIQPGGGQYDLIKVQWVRRVKKFPEKASLYVVADLFLEGDEAKGEHLITLTADIEGANQQKQTEKFNFGDATHGRGIQLPMRLDLEFLRPSKIRLGIWHMGVEWGHLYYRIVDEWEAQKANAMSSLETFTRESS